MIPADFYDDATREWVSGLESLMARMPMPCTIVRRFWRMFGVTL